MARVNIESSVFGDARYKVLAKSVYGNEVPPDESLAMLLEARA